MIKVNCDTPVGGSVTIGDHVTVSYRVVAVGESGPMDIFYAWVKMPDGRRLSLFVNRETGLVVADIDEKKYPGGTEFVRSTVPPPLTVAQKRALSKLKDQDPD